MSLISLFSSSLSSSRPPAPSLYLSLSPASFSLLCPSISLNLSSVYYDPFRAAIPSGAAGVIVGALIIYFTKAKGRQVVLVHFIVSTLILLPALLFLLSCPNLRLAGVTVAYSDG